MNQSSFFNAQFIDDDGTPLAGGLLHTYASGTTTPQATYEDQAGEAANTNPIVLDAAGRCDLWLMPDVEYTFRLERADETLVKTWDDVVGVAASGSAVTSVNELTGAVALTADEIPFTTGTSTTWFAGTDVTAALDDIINKVNDLTTGSTTAADVAIVDSGSYYTATNVETALQEVAADVAALTATAFSASIAGGEITTSVAASGSFLPYGSRTCTATGGTAPYTYFWIVSTYGGAEIRVSTIPNTAAATFSGAGVDIENTAIASCFVTDAVGRVTNATVHITATHAA